MFYKENRNHPEVLKTTQPLYHNKAIAAPTKANIKNNAKKPVAIHIFKRDADSG